MINQTQLTSFVNSALGSELLDKAKLKDSRANSVQIEGKEEVNKIALGVTCNEAFLQKAAEFGADYCIFHHGIDTTFLRSQFPTHLQKQLQIIFDNQMTVAGYHYALDAHPEIGNNAQIIAKLGAETTDTLIDEWGFVAKLKNPKSLKSLKEDCNQLFNKEIHSFASDYEKEITTIGVCSGGAKPSLVDLEEMKAKGVELYISGETSEHVPHMMISNDIPYFVCGHYDTETFGVKALGEKIKEKFEDKITIEFIDVPNPI